MVTKSMTRLQYSRRAAEIGGAKKIGVALGPGLPFGLVGLGMLAALIEFSKIPECEK
jgi:hypothetical protein